MAGLTKVLLGGKLMFPSDYVAAVEFRGRDVTLTIAGVRIEQMQMQKGGKQAKPILAFKETKKKLALNKTNAGTIADIYGTKAEDWIGKRITLYPTRTQFGRETVDCIRVREKQNGHAAAPLPDSMTNYEPEEQNADIKGSPFNDDSQARPPQAAPQPNANENPPSSQAAGGDGGLVPEVAADIANGRKGTSPTVVALGEMDQSHGAPSGEESQTKPGKSEATDIQLREAIGGEWAEATKVLFDATDGAIAADVFAKALGKWAMGLQKKGKESSISFETRKKLYLAIKASKFDFTTGKIAD